MLHVIARIDVLPGKMEEFTKLFKANVPNVLAEDGCYRYEPCVDMNCELYAGDENAFTVLETWESEAHLKAHLATDHMVKFAKDAASLRTGSKLTLVEQA